MWNFEFCTSKSSSPLEPLLLLWLPLVVHIGISKINICFPNVAWIVRHYNAALLLVSWEALVVRSSAR